MSQDVNIIKGTNSENSENPEILYSKNEKPPDKYSSSDYTYPIPNLVKNSFSWKLNKDFEFYFCSDKVEYILGYKSNGLYNTNFFKLMPKDEGEKIRKVISSANKDSNYFNKFKSIYIRKDGTEIILHSNIIAIFDEKNIMCGFEGVSYISESVVSQT